MTTLRIGAAQLDFHAAFEGGGVQALREPTGSTEGFGLAGLRTTERALDAKIRRLREQIERAYLDAFQPRLEAVIRFCLDHEADVLVLPEYSIPVSLLPAVAVAAGPTMVVVAGSHTVTVDGWRKSGIYERLGRSGADEKPVIGGAVAPVIQNGRALALQPKLSASSLERDLIAGQTWAPVDIGSTRLGVLSALDFLKLRDVGVASLCAAGIAECATLAVIASTPLSTLPYAEQSLEEHLAGSGRPIAYANHAREGGTRIATPESQGAAILAAGRMPPLPAGVEGVVLADVHVGDGPQRFRSASASRPVAAAVLMDLQSWRELRSAADRVLATTNVAAAFEQIERLEKVFRRAAESSSLPDVARARWRYLADGAEGTHRLEHLKALVRDVWLDGAVQPEALEKGLIEGTILALRDIERQKPDAEDVIAVRVALEHEAASRRKEAPSASSVVEQVVEGLLDAPEPLRYTQPGADGRFERWMQDPGKAPEPLRRKGFEGFAGCEQSEAERARDRDPQSEGDAARAALIELARFKELDRIAGLLALWGHQPAWFGLLAGATPALALRDGQLVLYTPTVPTADLLDLAGPSPPQGPPSVAPTLSKRREIPLALIDEPVALPPRGVRVVSREIRALAHHEPHMRALADFLISPEGERFVEPEARIGDRSVEDASEHFWSFLTGTRSLCLLIGSFGMGRSTVMRAFAALQSVKALQGDGLPVVFVDLRAGPGHMDLADRVRGALGVADVAPVRFAVECGQCVLMIDGLDSVRSRASPAQVASTFESLIAWRTPESKIIVSGPSRDIGDGAAEVDAVVLAPSLGASADAMVIELLPFDDERIRYYLDRAASTAQDADRAWTMLNKVADLKSMARQPLLLDMIRSTLPVLFGAEKVALGDLYEGYVQLWSVIAGTQQRLSPEDRIDFVEALARCVWRRERGVEGDSVRASVLFGQQSLDMSEPLRRKMASDPEAHIEIRAGSFVVSREAEGDRFYRLSHTSFLEYLVARRSVRRLAQGDSSALDLPRFTPAIIAYCLTRPEWGQARAAVLAVLLENYRGRISENALLLAHADRGLASTKERPFRLVGADLAAADLAGARLDGAWLNGADLSDARLAGASFVEARLDGALLSRADLRAIDARDASLRSARAYGARLDGAKLSRADLRDVSFEGSTAITEPPHLDDAQIDGARVAGAAWREPFAGISLRGLVGVAAARFRGDPIIAEGGPTDDGGSVVGLAVHRSGLTSVAYSPDGAQIATACLDGSAHIWEAQTGRLLVSLDGHEGAVTGVAFSPDSAHVATSSWDKTARIWEAQTGRLLTSLQGHESTVTSVAFSPDGASVATSSRDKTARIWHAETGRQLLILQGHTSHVRMAVFSPDGRRLATAAEDQTVKVWDVATRRVLATLTGHAGYATAAIFSPDNQLIATASSDKHIRIWEALTYRLLSEIQVGASHAPGLCFSPDGKRLAAALDNGTAAIWEVSTGRCLTTLEGHTDRLKSVAFAPDNTRIATASYDQTAIVWEASTGSRLFVLRGHVDAASAIAISADGSRIAVGLIDATARIWDARSARLLVALRGHTGTVAAAAFSRDGAQIATASQDSTVRLWDASTGECRLALRSASSAIRALAFIGDSDHIATASRDHTARVWEASTGKLLHMFSGPAGLCDSAFSPDGARLITILNRQIARIWITSTGQIQSILRGDRGSMSVVAASSDGALLAAISDDRAVRIWETSSSRVVSAFSVRGRRVNALAISPDGARLVTASDHSTCVWEAQTGRLLGTLKGCPIAVAFSPDGARVVTIARDHTARIWDASSGRELVALVHVPGGGMAMSGASCSPSGTVDLDIFSVRTGARSAPLSLYHDVCVRPESVVGSLAGEPVTSISIPMDRAERRAGLPLPAKAEAPPPTDLTGAALIASLANFAARRDIRLAESTLARCSAQVQGVLRAGSPGTLSISWSLPEGLDKVPGFGRSAKVLLVNETEQRPLDLSELDTVTIPASAPGRVSISITFFLDGAERTLEFSVTTFAKNPYIVGSPITDQRDFYGRVGLADQILAALEDDSIAIRGEVRIGKTSLLNQLVRVIGPSAEMVSLQQYAGRFSRLLPDLARRLAPDRPIGANDEYEEVDAAITHRLASSPAAGRRAKLVLILDEVQFFAHAWELRHQFRALLQARRVDGLRAVVAGPGSGLRALAADPDASAFLNMFQPFYLGPMRPDEIARLVRAPLGPGITITGAAVDRVVALSAGRPLVAQILCRHALDRVRFEERATIDDATIDQVLHEIAFHDLVHNFYAYPARWAALPRHTQEALLRVASLREDERVSLDRATLRLLAEHDLADVHQRRLDVEPTFLMWIQEEMQ